MSGSKLQHGSALTPPSKALLLFFRAYLPWYLRRNFHALRIANAERVRHASSPLVLYLNHASWWDPLASLFLARRFFPAHRHHAPMDASALERYRLLAHVGMFPVEQGTRRGAAQFLRAASKVLSTPQSILWVTPQGAFTDVRTRPIAFKPGLAGLLARNSHAVAIPLAIEYTYWDERLPEILINVGEPLRFDALAKQPEIEQRLASGMQTAQDALAALAIERNPAAFDTLLSGSAGVGLAYDLWRRTLAFVRGQRYRSEHTLHPHRATGAADTENVQQRSAPHA